MDALPQRFEQEICIASHSNLSKTVTFLPAFAGFSAKSGEKCLAKSRFSETNGLARGR
jgi:hypothetical protein